MRLALLWALGLLGAGSPLPSRPLPDTDGTKEEQARPARALRGPLEPQILQDNLTLSLAEVLQTNAPETLRIKLELDGESHILELLQNRELVPGRPTLVWYQPDGTRVVSEGHTLWRRDVVTETKIIELVIVADHSEVQRYPDVQHLMNRTLEVALLLDTFFRPLNVRVVLVGLEVWTQQDWIEISRDPGLTLDNFLHWRRTHLLPRLPHDSAQLVTATAFSGPVVGMAVQNSICSPDFSGGVNMDHSTSILGVASSIAHELGHSLGLDHDPPGNSCPCPGPAPAKSCIMEASTDFLPGLNFSNCSRRALEKALLDGMGSCLFERMPSLPSKATIFRNVTMEQGKQFTCVFPNDCTDPCCDPFTCQLRPGAQCAADGPCCQNCKLRPAGWQCRPARGDCDLPEFCTGDRSQCPPDASLGDGEPCAGGQAVCMQGRCASYAQQCQALWGPGAQPATPLCLLTANTRGDAFGNCGRSPTGSYVSCAPRDAICGQLQCQGGMAQPLLGSAQELRWETLEANGTRTNCSWVHLDLGRDVAQPLLTLPGTACGPGLVCIDHRCQPVGLLGAQECRSKCHGHGVCDSNRHCHCGEGWAPPDCSARLTATRSLTTGLPLSLLLLLILVLLGASYWHRARLRQRLCQLKGPSCQYRAAQSGPPERPGPPQRAPLMSGAKQASALGFPAPPSRPLPPDPVPKRFQAELADRPNPPTYPLPADPVVRHLKSQGPAKPPPPRKPLPADPQGRRPSQDLPGPGVGIPPLLVPSRPAPPPPAASSLYL
ncbi:ADAM metallopeptidase domain 15 [Rhinolophus ferrumequinum]|uniref:ADAM metallopeptidase domain 15 n=1 Tax=Rhinolophus ferrumequinum TaxID=59479 RepID=A0A7J7SVU5_RHIFE|nr:ADAM metallopeptidase domain 15 [Rhinolophus ferrumequinum]